MGSWGEDEENGRSHWAWRLDRAVVMVGLAVGGGGAFGLLGCVRKGSTVREQFIG